MDGSTLNPTEGNNNSTANVEFNDTKNTERVEEKEVGRPTKYSEEIIKKTKEYIEKAEDENISLIKQSNSEKGYEMYENKLKVNLPTIEGLARYLEIHKDTVYTWRKEYKEFSDLIATLLDKQAERLVNCGLSGDYNSTIAKVLLTKHGYVDKSALVGGGEDDEPIKHSHEVRVEDLDNMVGIYERNKQNRISESNNG